MCGGWLTSIVEGYLLRSVPRGLPFFDELLVVICVFAFIKPKPKILAYETVGQIIGLKDAGHTSKGICDLTGAGPTSV